MPPVMERARQQQAPVYLETAEPANIPFYTQLSYRVLRELTEPVSQLPLWTVRIDFYLTTPFSTPPPMPAPAEALYFVALLPDQQIQQEVTAFKQVAAELFGSKHALKSPPHITLVPPFWLPTELLPQLQGTLADVADRLSPFPVQLRGFDHFGDRVIFIKVEPDRQLGKCQDLTAQQLQQQLGTSPDPRHYHPHLTVAFKDLKRRYFTEAWEYFAKVPYVRTFTARHLTLLRHNGQLWEILFTVDL
jgi:2'-5' RNA ligase